jgi:alkylation response protein AidB-like acyl-CoA dehydrogenase
LDFRCPRNSAGPGVDDFRYNAIVVDQLQRVGAAAEVTGETVIGIAMTEPGTGSDPAGIRTTAVRDGHHYVVNGAKTFISNRQTGHLFVIAARSAPDRHKALSPLVADPDTPVFPAAGTWRRSACTPRTPAS